MEASGIEFPGNEELQAKFLGELAAFARKDRYLFVVWYIPIDYVKLLPERLPPELEVQKIWMYAGLLDSELRPEPAWEVWRAEFAAGLR